MEETLKNYPAEMAWAVVQAKNQAFAVATRDLREMVIMPEVSEVPNTGQHVRGVINLRGRKVDPSEIEKVLAGLDGVDEAVVLGVTSPRGEEEIVRAVVACADGRLNYQRVTAWCRQELAEHKVPRSVIIVDAIPRTSRGKIDRAALLMLSAPSDPGVAHG